MRMQPLTSSAAARRTDTGFTLVELLVVMAIIGVLAALIVPSIGPTMRGSQLTQTSIMVVDQLNLARQSALSSNQIVEVRFYQFGDADIPGQTAANPGTGRYRALQTFTITPSGAAAAFGKVQWFPQTVIIDSGRTLSPLIGQAAASPATPTASTGTALNAPIPRVQTRYNSVSMRFLPDGSARLPTAQPWCFTLHGIEVGDGLATLPANFCTVQINPLNGHLDIFRP